MKRQAMVFAILLVAFVGFMAFASEEKVPKRVTKQSITTKVHPKQRANKSASYHPFSGSLGEISLGEIYRGKDFCNLSGTAAYYINNWLDGFVWYANYQNPEEFGCTSVWPFQVTSIGFQIQVDSAMMIDVQGLIFEDIGPLDCPIPGGILCETPIYTVDIPGAGAWTISLPISEEDTCCVHRPYFAGIYIYTDLSGSGADPLSGDDGLECRSYVNYGEFWQDLVAVHYWPGQMMLYSKGYTDPQNPCVAIQEDCDTVSYHGDLAYYWTIPNAYGYDFFNERFDIPFHSYLDEIRITFYETGSSGSPDAHIYVWESDGTYPVDPAPPSGALAEFVIPNADIVWHPEKNVIETEIVELELTSTEPIHVGFSHPKIDVMDTLSILSDDGSQSSTRSIDYLDGAWGTVLDDWGLGADFFIEIVVCPFPPPITIITTPSDTAFWNDHPYFWEPLHIQAVDHGGKAKVEYTTFEYFDGMTWAPIYTDYDGTDNLKDNYEEPIPGADGWSAYWDPTGLTEGYYPVRATMVDYLGRLSSDTIVTYYDPFPPVPTIIFPEVFNFPSTSPVDIIFTTTADNVAEMWVTVLPTPTSYSRNLTRAEKGKLDCFQGYNKGIPSFNQFNHYPNSTTHPGWNFGCYPTAVAACLKYWAQNGYPGLDGNGTMTDGQMVREIADSMGTNRNSGTSDAEAKAGAEAYIKAKLGPCKFKVEHVTGKDVTLKRYLKEMFENDEDVIPSDPTHVVVGNSFCVHPQFYVDFMDPGSGNEVQSTDWNKGFDGDKLVDMLVISPKEDTTIEVPDTAGIPEEVEPGTYHFPWEPNLEEYPPGHAYLVDVVIIDVMGHVGWDMVKIELFLRGDATGDGNFDLADVLFLVSYLYKNGPSPFPWDAGDANCDGVIDLGDVLYVIAYLYKNGPAPGCE